MKGLPEDISESDLRSFVGLRANSYLRKWRSMDYGRTSKISVNSFAGLCGPFWILYRKAYLLLLAYFAANAMVGGFQVFVLEDWLRRWDISLALELPTVILFVVLLGCYANYWYLLHACRQVRKIRARDLSDEQVLKSIRRKGGTTWLWMAVLVLALLAMYALLEFLVEI